MDTTTIIVVFSAVFAGLGLIWLYRAGL